MLKKIFLLAGSIWLFVLILYFVDILEFVKIIDLHKSVKPPLFVIIWSVFTLLVLWPIYEIIRKGDNSG